MPNLITVAQAREHIETDLGTDALQRLIDDADALIVERHGEHAGPFTELYYGESVYVYPRRRLSAVTSITEFASAADVTGTVLAASDYRIELGGWRLRRLSTGTNAATSWGNRLSLVYTTAAQTARRTLVEIDLVRLAAQYEAKSSERIGDYWATHVEYEAERERIVGRLGKRLAFA